jgi:hypothetical protein
MSHKSSTRLRWICGGLVCLLLPLYGCGYSALSHYENYGLFSTRTFRSRFIAWAYVPMGFLESRFSNREIIFHAPFLPEGWRALSFEPAEPAD